MKTYARFLSAVAGVILMMPAAGSAHFKLIEPASWLIETDRGDPQKTGPCGGSNTDWGMPSYIVSKVVGGEKLRVLNCISLHGRQRFGAVRHARRVAQINEAFIWQMLVQRAIDG